MPGDDEVMQGERRATGPWTSSTTNWAMLYHSMNHLGHRYRHREASFPTFRLLRVASLP